MLLPRLRSSLASLDVFKSILRYSPSPYNSHHPSAVLRTLPSITFLRSAHHASEGRANGPKDRPGRRLGAKRGSEQYVIPGNILFRQRGTKWFPGENCAMGRDHTIYATEKGYVKFYRDPKKHPDRQFIGVAFARDDALPYPSNAPRKRRLGMVAVPMVESTSEPTRLSTTTRGGSKILPIRPMSVNNEPITKRRLSIGPGYVYRETNYEIGKAMEKPAAEIRPYRRGDRFLAWRKRTERRKATAEARAAKQARKAARRKKQHAAS